MVTDRVREWLMDHPELLTVAFLLLSSVGDFADATGGGSTGAYIGP